MGTQYLNVPLSDYIFHKMTLRDSGEEYAYYLYIHSSGQAVIARENLDSTEFLYAIAGRGVAEWENRVDLDYTTFDRLAKG